MRSLSVSLASVSCFLPLLLTPRGAVAQDDGLEGSDPDYIIDADALAVEGEDDATKEKDGVDWRISTAATFNLQDNRNVVGQQSGTSIGFGFKLDGGLDWRSGDHELRNNLNLFAGLQRTPAIERFVKSQDALDADSTYLYHLLDWFGFFGRVSYNTTMFRGDDIRAEPTNYDVANLDGTTTEIRDATTLNLTEMFLPSRFRQSLGVFAQPYRTTPLNIETRVGGGARQSLANGQLAINDDEETADVVEVEELDDVLQAGAEAAVELWGSLQDKRIIYRASAEAMIPLANNQPDDDDRSALELTNFNARASVGLRFVEWASLDYEFATVYEPQLVDQVQIRNNLLLTFGVADGSASAEAAE
ncbi:MAG: hypothetical protein AAGN82_20800 [Myxococcota bacterium]